MVGQVTVPIYQGGADYSGIRQAKETAAQRRLDLDRARDQARVGVLQFWAQTEASKHSLEMAMQQVKVTESALNGVSEEARLGQRTTLDVLNAQQELVGARVNLLSAQRDRIVNSYSAAGRARPAVAASSRPARRCLSARRCTISRCATPGSARARRTDSEVASTISENLI